MRVLANLLSYNNNKLTFEVDELNQDQLERLKNKELVVEFKKYNESRSLNANAYFWKLCDSIAKALGTDKDTVYLLQLSKYGVFVDVSIIKNALAELKKVYRYVDVLEEDEETATVRCYIGSSHYDSKEMADLINGTVADANEIGVETWQQEEIDRLVREWEANTKM